MTPVSDMKEVYVPLESPRAACRTRLTYSLPPVYLDIGVPKRHSERLRNGRKDELIYAVTEFRGSEAGAEAANLSMSAFMALQD